MLREDKIIKRKEEPQIRFIKEYTGKESKRDSVR